MIDIYQHFNQFDRNSNCFLYTLYISMPFRFVNQINWISFYFYHFFIFNVEKPKVYKHFTYKHILQSHKIQLKTHDILFVWLFVWTTTVEFIQFPSFVNKKLCVLQFFSSLFWFYWFIVEKIKKSFVKLLFDL